MEQKLISGIEYRVQCVRDAIIELNSFLTEIRSVCKHERVLERSWRESGNPRRICLACGLEEIGSYWSGESTWSQSGFGPAVLGNERGRDVFVTKDSEQFWNMRIPFCEAKPVGRED